jgi:hypothetical protein
MIRDDGSGCWFFSPSQIPDPGVKKAPDPGSGTLVAGVLPLVPYLCQWSVVDPREAPTRRKMANGEITQATDIMHFSFPVQDLLLISIIWNYKNSIYILNVCRGLQDLYASHMFLEDYWNESWRRKNWWDEWWLGLNLVSNHAALADAFADEKPTNHLKR